MRAVANKMRDTVGKRLRLSRTGARDNQKWRRRTAFADAVFDRCPLALVQFHKKTTLHSIAPFLYLQDFICSVNMASAICQLIYA